ncbi:MAG: efflux RND transporter permease subunit [Planctomycetota bacterium]
MDIVRLAISKPVGVTVGVIFVVMFGLIGFTEIPIQLTPTVDRPVITVETSWPGRSPEEIVDEIVKEQEEELKNVSNLRRMRSLSSQGTATIELEFYVGADISRGLQEVSDALRQVSDYPDQVEEPKIKAADGASENAIAWIITELDPEFAHLYPGFNIAHLQDDFEDEIQPYIERIDGVAEVNVFGGRGREVQVLIDTVALAQRGLNHLDVVNALRGENQNVSAGTISEGKRLQRVRLLGQYETTHEVEDTIIAYRDGNPVYVKDVATVEVNYEKRRGFVRSVGGEALAMNVIRQSGANVVTVMEELRGRLDEIKSGILPNLGTPEHPTVGQHLRMRQVYDETTYIDSAIGLVTQNLFIGGALAGVILMLFLRSFVSTSIVALAIPISVIGTFLVLLALGRTLNVISLAGLSFAVGMVVDNAIVVLENIYRRLQLGEPPMKAAYRGGKEVWGAILASTLTTAAVFIPVLTIQEEAGQLFRDISLAIVAAVVLSLIVSITVIPAAASRWLHAEAQGTAKKKSALAKAFGGLFGIDALFGGIVRGLTGSIRWLMGGWRGWTLRPLVIAGMTAASIAGAVLLAPPLDYLPAGNRNLVFGGLLIPPGLSVTRRSQIADRIEDQIKPYVEASADDPPEEIARLAPIPRGFPGDPEAPPPFEPVPIDNFFIGAFGSSMFGGATSEYEQTVIPIGQLLSNAFNGINSDIFGGARQSSLFSSVGSGGSSVNVEISGPELESVTAAAGMMYGLAGQKYGFGQNVSADPSNFNLAQQELRLEITDRARELGLTTQGLGVAIRGLFDGAFVGDYKLDGENVDLVVLPTGRRLEKKEDLAFIPVATPAGPVVPVDDLVKVVPSTAPQDIRRIEELPSVVIQITPPQGTTVEQLIDEIQNEVIEPAMAAGLIDRTMRINLDGTAAKLDEVRGALFGKTADQARTGMVRTVLWVGAGVLALAGLGVAVFSAIRASVRKCSKTAYGTVGALVIGIVAGLPLFALGYQPELIQARMVWALLVTYLLMAALFESFVYPFVIMFTVPLAVVGGFAGLKIVHEWSLADPTKAPQQLDVLTMLGFVILIGVVVNNAILLVHQALNFMRGRGESDDDLVERLEPLDAIAMSVKTRIRPIFMSVLTSVGGMLPLVLFPGAGSEMYRGLGSVVVGGLVVSTIFTLVLVPLLFSITVQAVEGLKLALSRSTDAGSPPMPKREPVAPEPTREREPELQPA